MNFHDKNGRPVLPGQFVKYYRDHLNDGIIMTARKTRTWKFVNQKTKAVTDVKEVFLDDGDNKNSNQETNGFRLSVWVEETEFELIDM